MAKEKEPRREEVKTDGKTKRVYFFVDEEKGINQKCREVYKNKQMIVHYPIGFDGGQRYKTVEKFVFTGFKNNSSLPTGIQKSAKFGFGFTKTLRPLMDIVEEKLKIREIHVIPIGKPSLTAKILTLNETTLQRLHLIFKNIFDRQKQARLDLAKSELNLLFPKTISAPEKKYVANSVSAALSNWTHAIEDFSGNDKAAIKELFDMLALTDDFFTMETLISTKETLDKQYIEDVIDEYESMLLQKHETSTLEKKWQEFLAKHNWVFSYMFSYPVMLFQKEAFVGGKNLSNKNGKVTDFLIKNALSENVAFLEIKTHRTALLGNKKAYRGNDVYSMSKDVTGGIAQVLDQRDNFQKQFSLHLYNSSEAFETLNSKCVVLMGMLDGMSKAEIKSFELFRSNCKDVELIAFDELLARFQNLRTLITQK